MVGQEIVVGWWLDELINYLIRGLGLESGDTSLAPEERRRDEDEFNIVTDNSIKHAFVMKPKKKLWILEPR
jgi:hypothetical protein